MIIIMCVNGAVKTSQERARARADINLWIFQQPRASAKLSEGAVSNR